MGTRHTTARSSGLGTVPGTTLAISAAALVMLAGARTGFAQTTKPAGQAPYTSGSPTAAAARQAASAASKVSMPQGSQAMRNPLATDDEKNSGVKVDEQQLVDLHVNDMDLATVLKMLSLESERNIVASKNVSATVTANLFRVSFYEALDSILHVNGFGYIEKGNTIYVYTLSELEEIYKAMRQKVTKAIRLNYLNGTDASTFVKPLLSDVGQITINGKTEAFNLGDQPVGADDFAYESLMVVSDYEENVAEIEKMVKALDTRPTQVLVEATILQTALNEANAWGIDFAYIGSLSFADFVNIGGPLKAVDGLISGSSSSGGDSGGGGTGGGTGGSTSGTPLPADGTGNAVVINPGNTSGPGTLKVGIVQDDVAAFLRLLDEVTDTTVISRPNILTLNRMPARVLVGRKVGYISTTTNDTSSTETVQFLDTGTQLYLRPFVSTEGTIRMELKPKVSEAFIRNVTNSQGGQVTIPDELANELTANVLVRDGQTIVLGGLFKEATKATRRQVPFAGDLPIIGAAFQGYEDSTDRTEIIFMITPTIVSDATLAEAGRRASETVDRVRTGARNGLLPWSREKQSGLLLVEAERLAAEGKTQAALSKVDRSLELDDFQPDAIRLREKLMNEKEVWPTRDMLNYVIHGEQSFPKDGIPGTLFQAAEEGEEGATPTSKAPGKTSSGATAARTAPSAKDDSLTFRMVGDNPAPVDESISTASTNDPDSEGADRSTDRPTGLSTDEAAAFSTDTTETAAITETTASGWSETRDAGDETVALIGVESETTGVPLEPRPLSAFSGKSPLAFSRLWDSIRFVLGGRGASNPTFTEVPSDGGN